VIVHSNALGIVAEIFFLPVFSAKKNCSEKPGQPCILAGNAQMGWFKKKDVLLQYQQK